MKRKRKRMVFWIVVIIFFGALFLREQYILYKLGKVQKSYQEQLSKLKVQNQQLSEQLKMTKRPDYYESLAREKLGLSKPGEILIIDKNKRK